MRPSTPSASYMRPRSAPSARTPRGSPLNYARRRRMLQRLKQEADGRRVMRSKLTKRRGATRRVKQTNRAGQLSRKKGRVQANAPSAMVVKRSNQLNATPREDAPESRSTPVEEDARQHAPVVNNGHAPRAVASNRADEEDEIRNNLMDWTTFGVVKGEWEAAQMAVERKNAKDVERERADDLYRRREERIHALKCAGGALLPASPMARKSIREADLNAKVRGTIFPSRMEDARTARRKKAIQERESIQRANWAMANAQAISRVKTNVQSPSLLRKELSRIKDERMRMTSRSEWMEKYRSGNILEEPADGWGLIRGGWERDILAREHKERLRQEEQRRILAEQLKEREAEKEALKAIWMAEKEAVDRAAASEAQSKIQKKLTASLKKQEWKETLDTQVKLEAVDKASQSNKFKFMSGEELRLNRDLIDALVEFKLNG